jgi:hypothetical protein
MSAWNILGTLGAFSIIAAYALLQSGRWQSQQARYSVCNALGAALILVSLAVEPNVPSIVIESFWLLISVFGLWQNFRQWQTQRTRHAHKPADKE